MTPSADNEYHDPESVGSLRGAMDMWLALRAAGRDGVAAPIRFTLLCSSESRARRVAGFLRRRISCHMTRVQDHPGTGQAAWQVQGSTHAQIQSLTNLEHLWTWLRRAADSHQVDLVEVAVVDQEMDPVTE